MDIVLITDGSRPELLDQTLRSAVQHAAGWSKHRMVVVVDNPEVGYRPTDAHIEAYGITFLHLDKRVGVGGAKNFGAKYLNEDMVHRSELLCFLDDDMYLLPEWDKKLEWLSHQKFVTQLGGWRHPFHQLNNRHLITRADGESFKIFESGDTDSPTIHIHKVDAVTGNCFAIHWRDWLRYGPFDANALGPGQSEDFALSQRIRAGGGMVATIDPPVAIHCGLVNSAGEPATGWRECEQQITEQLAELPQEIRDDVLIARPTIEKGIADAVHEDANKETGPRENQGTDGHSGQDRLLDLDRPQSQQRVRSDRYGSSSHFDAFGSPCELMGLSEIQSQEQEARSAPLRREVVLQSPSSVRGNTDRQHPRYVVEGETGCNVQLSKEAHTNEGVEDQKRVRFRSLHQSELGGEVEARKVYDSVDRYREDLGLGGVGHPILVNAGSGQRRFDTRAGWLNLDLVSRPPDQVPDIICDARELDSVFSCESVSLVVSHHVHEHLGCGEADPITLSAYRVLQTGRSLLVFTPDVRKLAGRWLGGELDDFQFAVQVMGAYQGLDSDRHKWVYTEDTLMKSLRSAASWSEVKPFDWRPIAGADFAMDWYIAAVECVK